MKKFLFAIGFISLLSLAGCSEKTIIIYPPDYNGNNNNGGGTSTTSRLFFYGAVESRLKARAMSPIAKDVRVQIYAYNASTSAMNGSPLATGLYESSAPGILSGVSNYKMYLNNGTYNFYAVSDNAPFNPPTFTDGKSSELVNNLDYLWWGSNNHDVVGALVSVPIVMSHICTQISIEVVDGGAGFEKIAAVHVDASKLGSRIDLATGVIPPATEYGADEKLDLYQNYAYYIMVPIKTDVPMNVYFDLLFPGDSTPRTYVSSIALPGGELKAGYSYRFKAIIGESSVSFGAVNVQDWIDVDETGNPMFPTPI